MRTPVKILVAAGVLATAAGLATGAASADPPAKAKVKVTDIVGTGADVTAGLIDQEGLVYNASKPKPTNKLYSYDAQGSATIVEKPGCVERTRPNGSGSGITELEANLHPSGDSKDYCVDFARSSSGRATTDPKSILYIPFAIDGVTWAADTLTGKTNAPASLTITQLKAIFSCDASILGGSNPSAPVTWKELGGTSNDQVIPVVPVSTSGTRKFFLASIGVSTLGSCVQGQDNSVVESEGTNPIFNDKTTSADIVTPYSVGVYLAQSQNGLGTGNEGSMVLRNINKISPVSGKKGHHQVSTTFPLDRLLYNVVRNASTTGQKVPKYLQPIFGNGKEGSGWLCKNATSVSWIQKYGFRTTPVCGVIQ